MTTAAARKQASAETNFSSIFQCTTWEITFDPPSNTGVAALQQVNLYGLPTFFKWFTSVNCVGTAYLSGCRLPRIVWGTLNNNSSIYTSMMFSVLMNWGIYIFTSRTYSRQVIGEPYQPIFTGKIICYVSCPLLGNIIVGADPDSWSATAQGTATGNPTEELFGKDVIKEKNARVPTSSPTTV